MNRKQHRAAGKAAGAGQLPSSQAALEGPLRQAFTHHRAGRLKEAARLYRQVLTAAPDQPTALLHLGLAHWQAGRKEEGRRLVERTAALAPNYREAHYNLARLRQDEGDLAGAETALRAALRLKPDALDALINLGVVLSGLGRHEEARDLAQRAIALAPNHPQARYNLGATLKALGDLDAAAAAYEAVLAREADFLPALLNLGNLRHALGDPAGADALFRRVIALDPNQAEAHTGLGITLLLRGDFAEGWAEYEWRWRTKSFPEKSPPSSQPRWQGGAVAGRTVFLVGEQGLGDMIQFARYAAPLADRGARVLLRCDPKLVPLLRGVPGVEACIAAGDPPPTHDLWSPLMSLPRLLDPTLDALPFAGPYVTPPPEAATDLGPGDGRRRIGIVWAGSPGHPNDRNRSCGLETFLPLAGRDDVVLHSLQVGPPAAALDSLPPGAPIVDLRPQNTSLSHAAHLLRQLDLLITVDTAPAHLAGALGCPVWVLVAKVPDWRWRLGRDDSPWYPSLRLFRQSERGDWTGVMRRIAAALDRLRSAPVPSASPRP